MPRSKNEIGFRRGQAVIDYLMVLMIVMVIALIVIGLSVDLPIMGQSIQGQRQAGYWRDQARPFTVTEAFYRRNVSRFYLALEVQEDDRFNLTGLFVNNTQLAFYDYNPAAGDGIGTLVCGASACQTSPCSCDDSMRPRAPGRIVTEPYLDASTICGPNQQQTPLDVRLVYFRPAEPGRNLTETGSVVLPFSCQ